MYAHVDRYIAISSGAHLYLHSVNQTKPIFINFSLGVRLSFLTYYYLSYPFIPMSMNEETKTMAAIQVVEKKKQIYIQFLFILAE